MNGSMLDTNVVIRFMHGDPLAEELVKDADDIFIPVIVVGELFYGVFKSAKVQQNLEVLKKAIAGFKIVFVDGDIAAVYGLIKGQLRKKGINIPDFTHRRTDSHKL